MDCKKCQELILTDYLDNEAPEDLKNVIEQHLTACDECRKFLSLVQKTVIQPLAVAKRDVLSNDVIWSRLQEEIHAKEDYIEGPEAEMGIIERFKSLLFTPKPAFVLATFLAVIATILILHSSINRSHLAQNDQNNMKLVVKKVIGTVQTQTDDEVESYAFYFEQNEILKDYGTSMEEYFL